MAKNAIPPLTALRAFEAAARHLSFRRAAEELNITQSAISHQVAALEDILRLRLFRRLARRVELTDAGILYYPYLRDAFERIARGTALVSRTTIAGDLTVQVYVTVAVRWLIQRLGDFQLRHPDILVRFTASHFDWEFDIDAADLGMIHTRQPNRPNLHYTHLLDARIFPVCSPTLCPAGSFLRQPADLVDHALLQVYPAADEWAIWLAAAGVPGIKGRAAPKFDSYLMALEAAINGQGLAIVPHFLVAADLRAGRLVKPFDIEAEQPGGWYLVCRKERSDEPRITRFRDWLVAQIAADRAI